MEAPCPSRHNSVFFLGGAREKHPRDTSAWSAATWHDGLVSLLAPRVLTLARGARTPDVEHAVDELVVIVCAAIRRVVGPFQVVVDALLRDAAVCAQFDLGEPRSDHAQARRPGDLIGGLPPTVLEIPISPVELRVPSEAWMPRPDARASEVARTARLGVI